MSDLFSLWRNACGTQQSLSNEQDHAFLKMVKSKGFEGKIFSSVGDTDSLAAVCWYPHLKTLLVQGIQLLRILIIH